MSRGYNHRHGFDDGPLPPGFPDSEPPQPLCTVRLFRSPSRPWEAGQFRLSDAYPVEVPRRYSVREFMDFLGLRNPDPSRNIIVELAERPSGSFSKGYEIRADNHERMNRTLAQLGYDGSRSAGNDPHVWLWISDRGFD